jgi:hypothetical protein
MDMKSDTVPIPRSVLAGLAGVSASFTGRMHELLEKNTEGTIGADEKRELEVLVRVAQLDQVVTLALQLPNRP